MKIFLIRIIFILLSVAAFAQSEIDVAMGFANYEEYHTQNPTLGYRVKVANSNSIGMLGGIATHNLKKVKPVRLSDEVYTKIWGLQINDQTFISTFPLTGIKGFCQIIEDGHYKYFIGKFPQSKKLQKLLGIEPPKIRITQHHEGHLGFVIFPNGDVKHLGPDLLTEICSDNAALSKEIAEAKLEIYDVEETYEFLKRYNASK